MLGFVVPEFKPGVANVGNIVLPDEGGLYGKTTKLNPYPVTGIGLVDGVGVVVEVLVGVTVGVGVCVLVGESVGVGVGVGVVVDEGVGVGFINLEYVEL